MANITVTVYDSTENKRVPVELPDDAPANRIIAVLVEKLQLPPNGPDGAPLSYKFHHKNSGRQIQDAQTLADAAVKDGDILRLQPEITAGARFRTGSPTRPVLACWGSRSGSPTRPVLARWGNR